MVSSLYQFCSVFCNHCNSDVTGTLPSLSQQHLLTSVNKLKTHCTERCTERLKESPEPSVRNARVCVEVSSKAANNPQNNRLPQAPQAHQYQRRMSERGFTNIASEIRVLFKSLWNAAYMFPVFFISETIFDFLRSIIERMTETGCHFSLRRSAEIC